MPTFVPVITVLLCCNYLRIVLNVFLSGLCVLRLCTRATRHRFQQPVSGYLTAGGNNMQGRDEPTRAVKKMDACKHVNNAGF